jgi:hypothetical protein
MIEFKKALVINLFFCFIIFGVSQAQSIERQVLASTGTTITNGTISLDYTLGETIVGEKSNSTIVLTQGFHQGFVQLAVIINPIVFLQGALSGSLMNDSLRFGGYLPTTSPYSDNLTCNPSVFNDGGSSGSGLINDNIVDWMWIELRDANDNTNVIASRSGLLQRDGNIVDVDGFSDLIFNVPNGDYFIVVNHRNHLGTMTLNTINLKETVSVVDFTDANTPISFGNFAQKDLGDGNLALWSGDANGDGKIAYSGALSDVTSLRSQVFNDPNNSIFGGPPIANYGSLGYSNNDINMSGITYYTGPLTDAVFIRSNIFNHPNNSIFGGPPVANFVFDQQLPQ